MKPVILLHGAIGATDQLEPLGAALEKNFDVYMLGFSGHGRHAFNPGGFGIGVFAQELKDFIIDNKLEQPSVFGYSMGGYVALYLASMEPQLMGTIATLGTKFGWSPEAAEKEIKMLDATTILEKVPKFAESLKARHGDKWKDLLSQTANMMKSLGDNNLLTAAALAGVKNKVAVGLADHDNMVSLEETLSAYKAISDAKMYMLPGTKHPIESADAELLAAMLISVL